MTTTTKALLGILAVGAASIPFLLPRPNPPPRAAAGPLAAAGRPEPPSAPPPAKNSRGQERRAPRPDQFAALRQQAAEEQELILPEFARLGGSMTKTDWVEQDIANVIKSSFGNDRAAFDSFLEQEGKSLEQFKQERINRAIVSIMKARMTQGITDPDEKKRAIDEWLTELRLASLLEEPKVGAKRAEAED